MMRRQDLPLAAPLLAGGLLLSACAPAGPDRPDGIPLELRPADLGTRLGPRFLPASVPVPLSRRGEAGGGSLQGFLPLGPKLEETEPGFPLFLEWPRSGGRAPALSVGSHAHAASGPAGEPVEPTASHLVGRPVFRLDLSVPHLEEGVPRLEDEVVEILAPSGTGGPPPDRLTAYAFSSRIARVTAGGTELTVLLSDGNSDGIFGLEDFWIPLEDADLMAAPFTEQEAREVGDFAWAAGRAWMLHLEGTAGRRGALVPHDPSLGEEQDRERRALYPRDRAEARAGEPLRCRPAGAAGRPSGGPPGEEAGDNPVREGRAPRLLLFDAPSCRPCRALDRLVLTAGKVASAGEGVLCQRIDAAADPGILERHALSGVPSGVLLDPAGEEIFRFEGYVGVDEMAAILRRASR